MITDIMIIGAKTSIRSNLIYSPFLQFWGGTTTAPLPLAPHRI
jgi:hypothetical protein